MEVHAHTHTPRKKWTHYFWEFLMLFLAVFCGFLAESYREHLVEKKREKEYMKEIVANLKYDSIRCSKNANNNIALFLGMDSLRAELKKAVHGEINANALYYFVLQYAGKTNRAVFNTSAITELKNSGSLRLIENKKIVDGLADYYERKVYATLSYFPTTTQVDDLEKTQNEFFSLLDLDGYIKSYDTIDDKTYKGKYDYQGILEHKPALQLLKADAAGLERFYTELSFFEIALKNYNFWLLFTKAAAEKLIADIQKEYHLN